MNTNPKIDDIRKEIKTLYNEKKNNSCGCIK